MPCVSIVAIEAYYTHCHGWISVIPYAMRAASLDAGGWDTSNVTSMGFMLSCCSSLESLDLSSFDTSNVESMCAMFDGCYVLKNVRLGDRFAWVGSDGYLPEPSADYISDADGKRYGTAAQKFKAVKA